MSSIQSIANAASSRWRAAGKPPKGVKKFVDAELKSRGISDSETRSQVLSILGKRGAQKRWPSTFPTLEELTDQVSQLIKEGVVMPRACNIVFTRHGISQRNRAWREALMSQIGSALASRKKTEVKQLDLF